VSGNHRTLMVPTAAASTAEPVAVAAELTKRYGSRTVVDRVSFALLPGRIYGFLGPNGAGKSTTLRMLLGLVRPTTGQALITGLPYRDLPNPGRVVGALLDPRSVHPSRTGRAELSVVVRALGLSSSSLSEVAEQVGLSPHLDHPCHTYSLGMLQRLGLAKAIIGAPALLVLDEPANGLDPHGVRWLRGVLRSVADTGATVLISSHMLGEVQTLADEIIVLDSGRIVRTGRTEEILTAQAAEVRVATTSARHLVNALRTRGLQPRIGDDGAVLITGTTTEDVSRVILKEGLVISELGVVCPPLEEVFLHLTRPKESPHDQQ
jgi:ABC-2 type transport system ATP-binding protein